MSMIDRDFLINVLHEPSRLTPEQVSGAVRCLEQEVSSKDGNVDYEFAVHILGLKQHAAAAALLITKVGTTERTLDLSYGKGPPADRKFPNLFWPGHVVAPGELIVNTGFIGKSLEVGGKLINTGHLFCQFANAIEGVEGRPVVEFGESDPDVYVLNTRDVSQDGLSREAHRQLATGVIGHDAAPEIG